MHLIWLQHLYLLTPKSGDFRVDVMTMTTTESIPSCLGHVYRVKLEVYRAHNPHALSICAACMVINMASPRTAMYMHAYMYVRWSLPGNLCAWAEIMWPAVGMLKGCGYNGQQIDAICDAHGLGQTIWSILISQFFADFNLFVMLMIFSDA